MTRYDTIDQIQNDIVEEFNMLGDWMEKYAYIIDLGRSLDPLDDRFKIDIFRVRGCQSQVWLRAESDGDKLLFHADSDAAITKGLIALLVRVLSGQPASQIASANLRFVDEIGLKSHLSPNRSNGLVAMIRRMKDLARAHAESEIETSTADHPNQTHE